MYCKSGYVVDYKDKTSILLAYYFSQHIIFSFFAGEGPRLLE